MKLAHCLFLSPFFLTQYLNAQDVNPPGSFLKPYWGSVSVGTTLMSGFPADSFAFQSLSRKDDPSLHPNLNGYTKGDYFSIDGGAEFSIAAGFRFLKKGKSSYNDRAVLRFSLNYSSNDYLSNSYYYSNSVRFDTLNGSTASVFLDSVYHYNYNFSFEIRQVGVEASLMYNTNPEKLFGLYGGFSFGQYFSTLNTVNASYSRYAIIMQSNSSGGQNTVYSNQGFTFTNDTNHYYVVLEAKNSFSTRIGIPVGVTFKLAKTKKVLKNIQFFLETRPGLDVTAVSGYRTWVRPRFSAGTGVRVLFF
jgi:hypothetical protein